MTKARYAILLDGGFLTKKLYEKHGRPAKVDDIVAECDRIKYLDEVSDYELLRIYYYDAPPSHEKVKRPVSGTAYDLSTTQRSREAQSLYDQLVLKPDFALRMGETRLSPHNWKMRPRTAKELVSNSRPITDDDFVLDLSQKGVDIRIGMDMARLALRELVRAVVVVTADSDFIPAFKYVRREGVRVLLVTMGHNARVDLKKHADVVVD